MMALTTLIEVLRIANYLSSEDVYCWRFISFDDPEVKASRVQNFKNWSPAMVPESENSSIGLEYFCNEGDDVWCMDNEQLAEMAANELDILGLANNRDVVDHYVVRQSSAYPVYDKDYSCSLETVKDYLVRFKNLQTVGRSGMHRYNNMDHSMITGIMAAQNIFGSEHDLWDVNDDDEYLEAGPGEIVGGYFQRSFARMGKLAFGSFVYIFSGLMLFIATLMLYL